MIVFTKNILLDRFDELKKEQFIKLFEKYEYKYHGFYTKTYKYFEISTTNKTLRGINNISYAPLSGILDYSELEKILKQCNLLGI